MSVIAGIVCLNNNEEITKEELQPMLEVMRPAFPSDVELAVVPECNAALGRVTYRPDRVPATTVSAPTDAPKVFLAGEFYNDEVIKYESHADYLRERYEKSEQNFAQGLNGAFAAAIADPKKGTVILVTDHVASRSLFTIVVGDKFYFASEVKGLLAINMIPPRPNHLAIVSFLAREYYVDCRTIVNNIEQVDYATICRIHRGKIQIWPYWRYVIEPENRSKSKEYIEEFSGLLRRAVQRRVRNGRCAVLLSGGVDSRGILAAMDDPKQIQAVTFTLRTVENRHPLGDWALADIIAQRLRMRFSVFRTENYDFRAALRDSVFCSDGSAGFIYEDVWDRIRTEARLDYLLMGDECMGITKGLTSYARAAASAHLYSAKYLTNVQQLICRDNVDRLFEESQKEYESILARCRGATPYDRADELYMQQRLIHFLNPKRRVINRHGLGLRSPWLDLDILNFIRKTPKHCRIAKKLFRRCISHLNPKLFEIPRARDQENINLREELIHREKESRQVSEIIFDDNVLFDEIFDVSAVRNLVDKVCRLSGPPQSQRRPDPLTLLPIGLRLKLGALQRFLFNPKPQVSDLILLLRVITVAVTLRQLNARFTCL